MASCSVCTHNAQVIINQALQSGESPTALARSHGLSRGALRRHAARHLPEPLAPEETSVAVAAMVTVRPSAVDLAVERLALLKDRLETTEEELQAARNALHGASREAILALAKGDDSAEEAARQRQMTLTTEVATLEQRIRELTSAIPLATKVLEQAQAARAKREAAHWARVARTPGLTPGEQWCALTMAGARPHWDREGTKQHQPRSEERLVIVVSLKERYPFTDEE